MLIKKRTSNQESSPETKAERVRRLRNLANLSRKQVCEGSEINLNTLIGWEVGRHGGLSKIGAKRLIERVAHEGIICDDEWLLYGIGNGPMIAQNTPLIADHKNYQDLSHEEQNILQELAFFQRQYTDTSYMVITDTSMQPTFERGDYIAGINLQESDFIHAINKACIIETKGHDIMCRILKAGRDKEQFHLCGYEVNASLNYPTLYDVKLLSVAPVIWHRKIFSSF